MNKTSITTIILLAAALLIRPDAQAAHVRELVIEEGSSPVIVKSSHNGYQSRLEVAEPRQDRTVVSKSHHPARDITFSREQVTPRPPAQYRISITQSIGSFVRP